MKFFFDHCISYRIAHAIRALVQPEHTVEALRDRWPAADTQKITDIEWLTTLGREGGWIVITADEVIRKRPREREVWRAAKVTTFFMADSFASVPDWEQVRWIIDKWPVIVDQANRVLPGSAFRVPKRGNKLETI